MRVNFRLFILYFIVDHRGEKVTGAPKKIGRQGQRECSPLMIYIIHTDVFIFHDILPVLALKSTVKT